MADQKYQVFYNNGFSAEPQFYEVEVEGGKEGEKVKLLMLKVVTKHGEVLDSVATKKNKEVDYPKEYASFIESQKKPAAKKKEEK